MSKRYERGSKMEEKRKNNWVPRKRSHSGRYGEFRADLRGMSEAAVK